MKYNVMNGRSNTIFSHIIQDVFTGSVTFHFNPLKPFISRRPAFNPFNNIICHSYIQNFSYLRKFSPFLCLIKVGFIFCTCLCDLSNCTQKAIQDIKIYVFTENFILFAFYKPFKIEFKIELMIFLRRDHVKKIIPLC